MVPNKSRTYDFHFSFISSPPVNAAGTLVAMPSLYLLNNDQLHGYHYSNPKWMTERKRRGGKALPWSEAIKANIWAGQHVYPEVSSDGMFQVNEMVSRGLQNKYPQITLLFLGCDSQCSNETLGRQDTVQIFQGTFGNFVFQGKWWLPPKMHWKEYFLVPRFVWVLGVFVTVCAPQDSTIFRVSLYVYK